MIIFLVLSLFHVIFLSLFHLIVFLILNLYFLLFLLLFLSLLHIIFVLLVCLSIYILIYLFHIIFVLPVHLSIYLSSYTCSTSPFFIPISSPLLLTSEHEPNNVIRFSLSSARFCLFSVTLWNRDKNNYL